MFVLMLILLLGLMFVLVVLPQCRATGTKACIDRVAFRWIRETVHSYRATQVGNEHEQCVHTLTKTDCVLCSN
jgi:hypothetical protein